MNSTWLLKLYPDTWRSRYEPEFRALLEDAPMSMMDLFDIAFGAIDAHLRPQETLLAQGEGLAPPPPRDPEQDARRRVKWMKYHAIHLALFGLLSLLVVIINLLTDRSFYWSPIVIWAMAIPLSLHTMLVYRWRGWFGAAAVPLIVGNLGLIGINIWISGEYPWSLWTLSASAIPLIGMGLVAFGITTPSKALAISGGLIAAMLVAASFYEPSLLYSALFDIGLVISLLFAASRVRTRQWSLLWAHGFLFVAINTMAFAMNLAQDADVLWFQYVLAASSLPLAVHALVRFGLLEFYDSSWEQAKIAQLTERVRESAVTDAVQRNIFLTARIQRSFWMHLFLAVVVALDLTIINLLSGTETPWLVWPVGVWLVVLATHAGYAFGPNRLLSANIMFWIGTSLGLYAIDMWTDTESWWFWPVSAYAVIIAGHLGWVVIRPHWYGALLGAAASGAGFMVLANNATTDTMWWYWPVIGIVLTVALATPFAFNVLRRVSDWESRKVSTLTRK